MKWMSIEVVAQQHIQVNSRTGQVLCKDAVSLSWKTSTPKSAEKMQYHEVNRFVRFILSSNCALWNKRYSLDYLRKANRFP